MVPDFSEHNAEQQAVWKSFRTGMPARVPVMVVSNPRTMLLDPVRNTEGITFERYVRDPEVMLQVMIAWDHWNRHHLRFDHEMGLPSDGWRPWIDFQNVYEAAWLGAPIHFPDDNCPCATPLLNDANREMLFDRGNPHPFDDRGWMEHNWAIHDCWRSKMTAGVEFHGRPIASIELAGVNTDGPFTIATQLRGLAACTDLLGEEAYFHRLMSFITEATILRMKAYRERLGRPIRSADFGYTDDSIVLLSTQQFRDHVLGYHRRIVETFWSGEGRLSIHLCGNASRFFPILKDELGVTIFDTGFPIDLHEMRRQLGPDVIFQGGPEVGLLRRGPIEKIVRVTRDLLEGPAVRGGLFVLREANNLAPATPVEHIDAMYETARRHGRYD